MKDLSEIKCRFDSPQGYYDHLVATSLAGGFPASDDMGGCFYLAPNGRQCGIGQLFSPEDAAVVEEKMAGRVDDTPIKWEALLPPWLPINDAVLVQNAHDAQEMGPWDHVRWVSDLNDVPAFAHCTKREVTDAPAA